ncbi:MAG: methylthioribulose 1-phosphate dehydratase [Steroidobacteraceae bacterium]
MATNFAKTEGSLGLAIDAVMAAGRYAASRGWVPATSGNFSVRVGDHIAITRSGRDKGALRPEDVAVVALAAPDGEELSAEAPLHFARYLADPAVGAICHVHTLLSAVLGRRHLGARALRLNGWELQKALPGVTSHEQTVRLPIIENDQDSRALAAAAELELGRSDSAVTAPGYLVAGHGLYAWGRRPSDAIRHMDAFDALLALHSHWSGLPT